MIFLLKVPYFHPNSKKQQYGHIFTSILDLGLYYPKRKTQWVNRNTWPSANSCPDYICHVKKFQSKPHFELVMYGSFQIEDNSCLFKQCSDRWLFFLRVKCIQRKLDIAENCIITYNRV